MEYRNATIERFTFSQNTPAQKIYAACQSLHGVYGNGCPFDIAKQAHNSLVDIEMLTANIGLIPESSTDYKLAKSLAEQNWKELYNRHPQVITAAILSLSDGDQIPIDAMVDTFHVYMSNLVKTKKTNDKTNGIPSDGVHGISPTYPI